MSKCFILSVSWFKKSQKTQLSLCQLNVIQIIDISSIYIYIYGQTEQYTSCCISFRHIIAMTRLITAYVSTSTLNTQYKLSTSLVCKWEKLNDLHHVVCNFFSLSLQPFYTAHVLYIIHIAFHFTQRSFPVS